jgi:hypothetical protein
MAQPASQETDAALDAAAERIAEGVLADFDGARANPVMRAALTAELFVAAVIHAVLGKGAAKFAGRARPNYLASRMIARRGF